MNEEIDNNVFFSSEKAFCDVSIFFDISLPNNQCLFAVEN